MTVQRVQVGEVLELRRDPISIEADKEYRRIGIYSWGKGMLRRPPIPGSAMGSLRYFNFPEGALVLSNIQAWEAAVAVSGPADCGHVASNRFLPYVPRDANRVDINYLLHYFLSEDGLAALRRASPGTQVRNRTLGQKLFEALEIPLPDLPEQRRISSHLDRIALLSSTLLDTIQCHQAAQQAIANQYISALDSAKIPLRNVATLTRDPIVVSASGSYPMIGLLNRGRGVFVRQPIAGSETKYRQLFKVRAGQLIYSKLFGWEGSIAIVPAKYNDYYVSPEFPTFELHRSQVLPGYIAHLINTDSFTSQVAGATTGMGQRRQRVNIEDFEQIKIPLPSLDEQRRIAEHLDKLKRVSDLVRSRKAVAAALLPASRNEVFSSLR